MTTLGATQTQLNQICSSLFDEMGLPNDEAIEELDHFLKSRSLKGIDLDATIKTSIPNLCTVFESIKALTVHDYYHPLMIICKKFPKRHDFEFLDANTYLKLNALEKAKKQAASTFPTYPAPIPALTPSLATVQARRTPGSSSKAVLNPSLYIAVADQTEKADILSDKPTNKSSFKKK